MTKKIIATIAAGFFLMTAPAGAAPLTASGEITVKYAREKTDGEPAVSGMMYGIRLTGEQELGGGWSLYARLGAQYATRPSLGDFNTDVYGEGRKSVAALDQWGVIFKQDDVTYKLGRQNAAVGVTELLYNRPDTAVGRRSFVDGLSVVGTAGALDIGALIAREDNDGQRDNKLYAVRVGFSPAENFKLGTTLARFRDVDTGGTNHWALDGAYGFGKSTLTAEFARSNSAADNKAYAVRWEYDCDGKTALSVTAFRVETNGDMGGQSEFDNGNRGMHYGVTHKLSDAQSIEVMFKDQRLLAGGAKNAKLEATLTHSF